jgi:hypothetical protein
VQITETKKLCFYSDLQYFDEQRTFVLRVILPAKIEAYESRKIQGIIYWCNMIVENFPKNNVASETLKNRIISEARAIRAIMMMNLVQLWETPPLADHIMTGEEGNTPAEDSWVFIEHELNEAAEGLPSKKGLDGQAEIGGRLTKEAAYAYLGKAYLWQKKYNEAASVLYNKVIATGLYELVPDLAELNRYNCYENAISELGVSIMQISIPNSVKYDREQSIVGSEYLFLSLVFPPDKPLLKGSNWDAFMDEFLKLTNFKTTE